MVAIVFGRGAAHMKPTYEQCAGYERVADTDSSMGSLMRVMQAE